MNEYNIVEFVKEYKESENKVEFLERLKVETYVSFSLKKAVIEAILNNLLEIENGLYTYDAMNQHLFFVLGTVSLYTNLTYDEGESVASYDALVESGLIDIIIQKIGADYNDFVNHFDHTLNVVIQTNNSIPNVLNCFLTGLTAAVQNLDKEKLAKVLENIN